VNADTLLTELGRRGIRIEPRPNGNLYLAPKDLLTPELVERVRSHKAELVALLSTPQPDSEAERVARLDARHEQDRLIGRGHDVDPTAPSYVDWAASRIPENSPARSLIRTCREYGVGLRLDPHGTLVVLSNGRAWRSLVAAIEAHVDDIALLLATGWNGNDA
jgi:hypothetical protein